MADEELERVVHTPDSIGARLRQAREAAGLSRTDIAARTKIAERHIAAIEDDRFGDLASSTYAVGFSRAYARSVGLDEHQVAHDVRSALDASQPAGRPAAPTFEPGDPARVPGSLVAWIAAGAAIVVIALIFMVWRSYYAPAASLPDLTSDAPPAATEIAGIAATASAAPPVQGPVVFTATQDRVWVKFTDANGQQLMQKEMALGESYTLPADAVGPRIRTIRPDALRITVGGTPVDPIGKPGQLIREMPVSAAALLARGQPTPAATASPATTTTTMTAVTPPPAPRETPTARATPAPEPRHEAHPAEPAEPTAISEPRLNPVGAEAPAANAETSTVSQ